MGVFFVPSMAVSFVGRRVGVFVCSPSSCLISGTRVGVFLCSLSSSLLRGKYIQGVYVCVWFCMHVLVLYS